MKEITIKEKAKRYDEVLEEAKSFYVLCKKCGAMDTINFLENTFPELKESEDKQSKKWILEYLHDGLRKSDEQFKGQFKAAIAWLEKQGEQTIPQANERVWLYLVSDVLTWKDGIGQYLDDPRVQELAKKLCSEYAQKLYTSSVLSNPSNTGKDEPKFKVGDWLQYRNAKPFFVEEITKQGYVNGNSCLPFNWENEIHLWTIQDAKDGDVLACKDELILFKSYDNKNLCYYCWYNWQTNNFFPKDTHTSRPRLDIIVPATKEQRDLLFQKMKEAGYEWDAEKKELKRIEQKSDDKIKPFDEFAGLTDFERTLADICIGWTGEELGWKQYIKDNADVLLKIAIKKFNSVQDASFA